MAGGFSAAQNTALDWLERNHAALSADHMTIWNLHEPSWREYKSSAWYMDRLEREGFKVERGTAGMPTAFRARWSNGGGPTLANSDYFGSSVASLGDLDGDGVSDLAVGAIYDDAGGTQIVPIAAGSAGLLCVRLFRRQ